MKFINIEEDLAFLHRTTNDSGSNHQEQDQYDQGDQEIAPLPPQHLRVLFERVAYAVLNSRLDSRVQAESHDDQKNPQNDHQYNTSQGEAEGTMLEFLEHFRTFKTVNDARNSIAVQSGGKFSRHFILCV